MAERGARDPGAEVRRLVAERTPGTPPAALADGTPLMGGGLGFDSVAVVELLLDLEERLGVPFPAELLEDEPLTLGRVIRHARESGSGPVEP